MQHRDVEGPLEIALVGDLTDNELELTDKLLSVEPGGQCTMYIDSPGGSPYCAVSLMTVILVRGLHVTGIVTGECSSAALWPFAACDRRLVTPYSVLLFHPMKWQSEEHVGLAEAAEWARHFGHLEQDMDSLLAELFGLPTAEMEKWIKPGRYLSGPEMAEAGLAELIDLRKIKTMQPIGTSAAPRRRKRVPTGLGVTSEASRPAAQRR
ncbi:MAG: ATP-dependent Clp protease proteolytic subunit [Pirellulales bacterium]